MKNSILYLLLLLNAGSLLAGNNDTITYPQLNKAYLKSYLTDTRDFVISPAKWQTRQWLGLGLVAGAGVLAYTQDEKIQEYFVGHQSTTADNLAKYIFEPFGDGVFNPLMIGSLYLGGRIAKDNRLAGTALTAAKSFVVTAVCTQVGKQLTHRHRPYQDDPPDHANWEGPIADIHFNSFPSGHSSDAFSLATVFAMEYRSTIWVPVLAYTLATGTAISRLYNNAHWASDVVIGSALGFVTGRFMWKQSRKTQLHAAIFPSFGNNMASVTLVVPVYRNSR
jgi:membrane-associated phospholipid phosphatase